MERQSYETLSGKLQLLSNVKRGYSYKTRINVGKCPNDKQKSTVD